MHFQKTGLSTLGFVLVIVVTIIIAGTAGALVLSNSTTTTSLILTSSTTLSTGASTSSSSSSSYTTSSTSSTTSTLSSTTSTITTPTSSFFTSTTHSSTTSTSTITTTNTTVPATSQLTVYTVMNGNGSIVSGFYTLLLQGGQVVNSSFTPAEFTVKTGANYTIDVQGAGNYYFQYWQDTGSVNVNRSIVITRDISLYAVMCSGPPGTCKNAAPVDGITVYANRIPAGYWAPCFALACSLGTGPGASMYFVLYNSAGQIIQTAQANEQGYTFLGLSPGTTYYVAPQNCDLCHGSTHDVDFGYWDDNTSSTVPMAATVGTNLEAWFYCTNGCGGG